jgi:hypothetical protein
MEHAVTPAPHIETGEEAQVLRRKLAELGFFEKAILERIGFEQCRGMESKDLPFLLWRTRHGDSLDLLIRLFLINLPVSAESFEHAGLTRLDSLFRAGLLALEGEVVRPRVKLLPCLGLLCAFDVRPPDSDFCLPCDYVMGIAGSSVTLANLTIRKQMERTLDLGTGCGIQALLAARHSGQVVATDRNPRALGFAGFNAVLNGIFNIEFREGDLFEPVRGLTFDLIVSNPPFVISPENRYIYRDGGMRGDEMCRRIVRDAPGFLSPGGYCQYLGNWVEDPPRKWYERPEAWFEGSGCDAWIIRSHSLEAAAYAAKWIVHTEFSDRENQSRQFRDWMAYYESEGIERIGSGLVSMRRTKNRKAWFHAEDAPSDVIGPGWGDSLALGFELRDFLETATADNVLLECVFSVSPDASLNQRFVSSKGVWKFAAATLSLARGLTYSGDIDSSAADLLAACDGKRTLRELVAEVSSSNDIDVESLSPAVCQAVRDLVQKGFLVPSFLNT